MPIVVKKIFRNILVGFVKMGEQRTDRPDSPFVNKCKVSMRGRLCVRFDMCVSHMSTRINMGWVKEKREQKRWMSRVETRDNNGTHYLRRE